MIHQSGHLHKIQCIVSVIYYRFPFTRVVLVSWKQIISAPRLSRRPFKSDPDTPLRVARSPLMFQDTIFMLLRMRYKLAPKGVAIAVGGAGFKLFGFV
jgi:hypothetical protein